MYQKVCSHFCTCLAHREKKLSRNCAIKVLNHSMTGMDGVDNSQKFVDILGLRTIFPLFMKTPKTARAGPSSDELEGWSVCCVCVCLVCS